MTKKQLAEIVFNRLHATSTRKEVIAAMVAEAGMTEAGASTYYSNFKNAATGGSQSVVSVVKVPQIDLTKLSDRELVELHNEHAVIPVRSFPSRDAAIAKVTFELKQTAENA